MVEEPRERVKVELAGLANTEKAMIACSDDQEQGAPTVAQGTRWCLRFAFEVME